MSERLVRNESGRISEEGERRITYAIAIALVCLLPSLVLGALLWHEIDKRSEQNKALIVEMQQHEANLAAERQEVREQIRAADIDNCREDELVKSRLRKIVAFNPEEVALTLEQLGIDPSSQRGILLTQRSKKSADEATQALAPRDCTALPDPTNPQSK